MRKGVLACSATLMMLYHVRAFTFIPMPVRDSNANIRPTSQTTFTISPSSSSHSWNLPTKARTPRDGYWQRSRTRCSARGSSLAMFDGTDLFQLQQWAGQVSSSEVLARGIILVPSTCLGYSSARANPMSQRKEIFAQFPCRMSSESTWIACNVKSTS